MGADPVRVWYLRTAGSALGDTLVWTLAPVYFVTVVGMSPLQLVLVGTFMELTIFVCEVPTGIVADVVSRKLSIVIGYLVMGAAIVFCGAVAQPWAVMVAWSVWGFGYTFTSGATDAWLADEIGVDNVRPVYLRSAQIGRVVALVAIGGSVALGLISLRLPVIAGGVVISATGIVLAFVMQEHGFKPAPRDEAESTLRAMVATGRAGARLVRRTPVLLLILAISAFWGAWSEAYDRLGEAHVIRDVGLPSFAGLSFVVWFGVISAASLLLSLLVARPANRRLEHAQRQTITRVLLFADSRLIATVVVFGLAKRSGSHSSQCSRRTRSAVSSARSSRAGSTSRSPTRACARRSSRSRARRTRSGSGRAARRSAQSGTSSGSARRSCSAHRSSHRRSRSTRARFAATAAG